MKYTIFYSSQAEKYLTELTPSKRTKVLQRIEYVASDPFKQDNNITKLTGTSSSYRLRMGNLRIIYYIETSEKAMYVAKASPRGSAYSS